MLLTTTKDLYATILEQCSDEVRQTHAHENVKDIAPDGV